MKLLRLAPENTKFGFMRFRRVSYPLSALLSIISVLMFLFVGMNFGIDFAGGTQVDMRAKSGNANVADIRSKGEGLENVGAATESAIDEHWYAVTHLGHHFRQRLDGCSPRLR